MDDLVTVIPTTVEHIRMLVADLREDDLNELKRFGESPFKDIWRSYKNSKRCNSAFIDGRIVAIWGINGSTLGFVGNPWVLTSTMVDKYPFVFASLYRREVQKMLKEYRTLESWVDASYTKSLQLMRIIGFKEREFKPFGRGVLVRLEMGV